MYMFVPPFSGLLEVSEQQYMQCTKWIFRLACARGSATVVNCAQYTCNSIPRLCIHHGDLVLVMSFWQRWQHMLVAQHSDVPWIVLARAHVFPPAVQQENV